jgi:hypothetical protein
MYDDTTKDTYQELTKYRLLRDIANTIPSKYPKKVIENKFKVLTEDDMETESYDQINSPWVDDDESYQNTKTPAPHYKFVLPPDLVRVHKKNPKEDEDKKIVGKENKIAYIIDYSDDNLPAADFIPTDYWKRKRLLPRYRHGGLGTRNNPKMSYANVATTNPEPQEVHNITDVETDQETVDPNLDTPSTFDGLNQEDTPRIQVSTVQSQDGDSELQLSTETSQEDIRTVQDEASQMYTTPSGVLRLRTQEQHQDTELQRLLESIQLKILQTQPSPAVISRESLPSTVKTNNKTTKKMLTQTLIHCPPLMD